MDNEHQGWAAAGNYADEHNARQFELAQTLSRLQTCIPVEVKAQRGGGVGPVGVVDVIPLVTQLAADGTAVPHGLITNVPYFRLQGGANAVIIDPQVGDIGMANFCSRDISKVKAALASAPPGSDRMHSMSDALYSGGIMNGTPTQYILFNGSGITVLSPQAVKVQAPNVSVTATTVSVAASSSASITSPNITLGNTGQTLRGFINSLFQSLYNGHTHASSGAGVPVAGSQMPNSMITSTVTGA